MTNIGGSISNRPLPEATYHKFMVVIMNYKVLRLTVWGEKCDYYKLLWKLRQVMRGHVIQPDIYDGATRHGITWLIIIYGHQYFRNDLMSSSSPGNITKSQITFLTSTWGMFVKQLSMVIPIRVSGYLKNG